MRVLRVISFAFLMAVLASGTLAGSPSATHIAAASGFANPSFQTQWSAGEAVTPNFYGPLATAHDGQTEAYAESSGGKRLVQYFDKARLELTNPTTGIVTSGLLASELVNGRIQMGDSAFQNQPPPAIPIAGDPDNTGPTYAQLAAKGKGLFDAAPAQTGNYAQAVISPTGDISVSSAGPSDPATFTAYDDATKHNVPRAFADYRTKAGLTTIGYALGEPFATTVRVAGTQRQVLVQVFERRVLTYTASNPDAFKVEFGNIGAHYYQWRYPNGGAVPTVPPATTPATVAPPVSTPVAVAPPVVVAPPPSTGTLAVAFTSVSSPIGAGNVATATIHTTPSASCSITVTYKSGLSKAKGLDPQQADANGQASWSWLVGGNTTPGNWPINVACSAGSQSATQRTTLTVT